MTGRINLFKSLLSKKFFDSHKHKLTPELFPDELHDLLESLEYAHITANGDLRCADLYNIHISLNKTLTAANVAAIQGIIRLIHDADTLDEAIAERVFDAALIELKATRIAQAALEIAHGRHEDWSKLTKLLDEDVTKHEVDYVSTDIDALLMDINTTYRWRFNIPELDKELGPVGPEVFSVLAGPVNSGKTALGINFVFGPEGFLQQGAKTLYIGNEESVKRTVVRGFSCYTGYTRKELNDDEGLRAKVKLDFDKIAKNLYPIDDVGMTFSKLNHIADKLRPDIIILDQLDKINLPGAEGRTDEVLGQIYEQARETAKKYQCAVFGVSQTSAESFGKLYYSFDKLAGSRVAKGANADVVLLLGQNNNGELSTDLDSNFRVINIAKSKLEGNGKKINCQILPQLSRFIP